MKDFSALPNTINAFPDVAAVDDPTGVGVLGTPWIKALIDEWFGFDQAILDRAGLLPNALDEVHDNSQLAQGLAKEHSEQTIRPDSPLIDIARGSWYNDTMSTSPNSATSNSVTVPGNPEFIDLGVYFPDGVKTILALEATGAEIHKFDPITMTLTASSGALGGLGAGVWTPDAMCNDNTYAYVMFHDATVPPIHKIQSYRLSDWTVNVAWPAAGTTLAAGVALPSALECRDRVIFANDTTLACLNSWVAAAAAASRAIETVDVATGAVVAFGAGDIVGGANYRATGRNLCSDGTNLFYTSYELGGATVAQVCSATIANPQVGCGGVGWPVTSALGTRHWTIATDGTSVYMFEHNATTGYITMIRGDATAAFIFTTSNLISNTTNGFVYPHQATFDGHNIWLMAWSTEAGLNDGAGGYVSFAIKIDPGLMSWADASLGVAVCDRTIRSVDALGPEQHPQWETCSALFDGRDMWFAPDPNAHAATNYIWRIPRVMVR